MNQLEHAKKLSYDGDVVDVGVTQQQQPRAVRVVALYGHVQRTEAVLCLGHHRRLTVQQQVDDLVVAASRGAVQRRQTVLCVDRTSTTPLMRPNSGRFTATQERTDGHPPFCLGIFKNTCKIGGIVGCHIHRHVQLLRAPPTHVFGSSAILSTGASPWSPLGVWSHPDPTFNGDFAPIPQR